MVVLPFLSLFSSTFFLQIFRPSHWADLIQRLQLLGENSSVLRKSKSLNSEIFLQFDTWTIFSQEFKQNSQKKFHPIRAFGSPAASASLCHRTRYSALWLPLDLVLEDAMDGYQVEATSAIEKITSTTNFYPKFSTISTYMHESYQFVQENYT